MFLFYIFTVAGMNVIATHTERLQSVWNYDDESSWPGASCREGGSRQSPIDIRTASVLMDLDRVFIKYGKLKLKGYRDVLVSGINNGHTIQFTTEGSEAMHPSLTGGPLQHEYRLEQIHFHWLSEHSVNGFKYPMEIHFVHKRQGFTVAKALEHSDGLAIIAVFCNVKPEDEEEEEPSSEMDEVMLHVSSLGGFGSRVSGIVLDVRKLLTKNPQAYVTYSGSLTSPECNEVVTWIIMDNPIFMLDTQYRNLSKLGVSRNNFRRLQPLNHTLYRPMRSYFYTPFVVQVFKDMYNLVKEFVTNITGMLQSSKSALLD